MDENPHRVKNSPAPPTTDMSPKWTLNPHSFTRNENIQPTATLVLDRPRAHMHSQRIMRETGVLIYGKRALVCGYGDVNKVCSMDHRSFVVSFLSTNQVLAQLYLLKNWTRSFSSPKRVMISLPQGRVLKTPGGGGEGMMSTNYPTHLGGAHKRLIRPLPPTSPPPLFLPPLLSSQTLQTATPPRLPRPLMRVCVSVCRFPLPLPLPTLEITSLLESQ